MAQPQRTLIQQAGNVSNVHQRQLTSTNSMADQHRIYANPDEAKRQAFSQIMRFPPPAPSTASSAAAAFAAATATSPSATSPVRRGRNSISGLNIPYIQRDALISLASNDTLNIFSKEDWQPLRKRPFASVDQIPQLTTQSLDQMKSSKTHGLSSPSSSSSSSKSNIRKWLNTLSKPSSTLANQITATPHLTSPLIVECKGCGKVVLAVSLRAHHDNSCPKPPEKPPRGVKASASTTSAATAAATASTATNRRMSISQQDQQTAVSQGFSDINDAASEAAPPPIKKRRTIKAKAGAAATVKSEPQPASSIAEPADEDLSDAPLASRDTQDRPPPNTEALMESVTTGLLASGKAPATPLTAQSTKKKAVKPRQRTSKPTKGSSAGGEESIVANTATATATTTAIDTATATPVTTNATAIVEEELIGMDDSASIIAETPVQANATIGQAHQEGTISIAGSEPPADSTPALATNAPKPARSRAAKAKKPPPVLDLGKHCAVQKNSGDAPCMRALTCKVHAINDRRAVPGRPDQFDKLLAKYQAETRIANAEKKRLKNPELASSMTSDKSTADASLQTLQQQHQQSQQLGFGSGMDGSGLNLANGLMMDGEPDSDLDGPPMTVEQEMALVLSVTRALMPRPLASKKYYGGALDTVLSTTFTTPLSSGALLGDRHPVNGDMLLYERRDRVIDALIAAAPHRSLDVSASSSSIPLRSTATTATQSTLNPTLNSAPGSGPNSTAIAALHPIAQSVSTLPMASLPQGYPANPTLSIFSTANNPPPHHPTAAMQMARNHQHPHQQLQQHGMLGSLAAPMVMSP